MNATTDTVENITASISKPIEYFVSKDGFAIDPETGEVLGMVDDDGKILPERSERFEIRTIDQAEWVLSLLVEQESTIAGLRAKRDAIVANIDSQIKQHENRLNFIHHRFDADLRWFAAEKIKGTKDRSVKTAYGTLAFRATQCSIKVIDMAEAVTWAKGNMPECVQVKESVIVTPLKGYEESLPVEIFEVTPPGESFSIKTGVK